MSAREALEFAAEHMSSDWPERCQEIVRRARAALAQPAAVAQPENMARLFHDTYERLAPLYGYETRKETQVFDPTSRNGRLMIAVCAEIAARGGAA